MPDDRPRCQPSIIGKACELRVARCRFGGSGKRLGQLYQCRLGRLFAQLAAADRDAETNRAARIEDQQRVQVAARHVGQLQAVGGGVGGFLNQADDGVRLGQLAGSFHEMRGLRRQFARHLSELQAQVLALQGRGAVAPASLTQGRQPQQQQQDANRGQPK